MPASPSNVDRLIRRVESNFPLTDEEKDGLASLPMQVVDIRKDQDIVRVGDRPSRSFLLIEGFTCLYKLTGNGKRQIMAFHVPGDLPDLQSLHLEVLDANCSTVSPCKVGFIQHESLERLCSKFPRIGSAFWRETLIEAAIFREWIVSIGQREAYDRVAHLFCEWVVRLRVVGLVRDDKSCDMPLTQSEIGDALGISSVHVSRTLKELRENGLVSLQKNVLSILDWDRLKQAGDFDPAYLHLRNTSLVA